MGLMTYGAQIAAGAVSLWNRCRLPQGFAGRTLWRRGDWGHRSRLVNFNGFQIITEKELFMSWKIFKCHCKWLSTGVLLFFSRCRNSRSKMSRIASQKRSLSKTTHDDASHAVNSHHWPTWHLPKHLLAPYRPPFCFNLFPSPISLRSLSSFSLSTSHLSSGCHLLVDCYWWYQVAVGFTMLESGANGLSNASLWMQPVKRGEIGSDLIRGRRQQNKMYFKKRGKFVFPHDCTWETKEKRKCITYMY